MDKRFLYTGLAVGAVIAIALSFAALPEQEHIIPMHETVSDVELPGSTAEIPDGCAYLLREYNGRIAVYMAGQDEPEMVLDVLVKHLPEQDRRELAGGVGVRDYSALVSRIEDYSS